MSTELIRMEIVMRDDVPIYVLHMQNSAKPDGTYENKLSGPFCERFMEVLDEIEKKGTKGAIVTVGKGKHYSDGLDLSYMMDLPTAEKQLDFLKTVEKFFFKLLTFPMYTVAACNGHCMAGGMLLALTHDARIMNSEKGFCSMTEIDIGTGLTPGFSELWNAKMPKPLGPHMMLTADRFGAAHMKAAGVMHDAVKADSVLEQSITLAAKYANKANPCMRDIKEDLYWNAAKALRDAPAGRAKL